MRPPLSCLDLDVPAVADDEGGLASKRRWSRGFVRGMPAVLRDARSHSGSLHANWDLTVELWSCHCCPGRKKSS